MAKSKVPKLMKHVVEKIKAGEKAGAYWQLCPVCNGRGTVPYDFYEKFPEGTTVKPLFFPTCRTCSGQGVLPIPAVPEVPFVPNPFPKPPYFPANPGGPPYDPYDNPWFPNVPSPGPFSPQYPPHWPTIICHHIHSQQQ